MSAVFLVGVGAVSAMIIILAIFSNDIIRGQRELRENFIKRRKLSLYKITLRGDVNKEFIKSINKSFLTRRREAVELLIHKSDMKITYYEYLMVSLLFGVIGWVIGGFLNNVLISIVLAVLMFSIPKSYLKFICNSIKRYIAEQLEPALAQIIGLLPSKKTLPNACEACLESMEEPLKAYFTEFINNINNANRSFEEALDDLARKIDSKPFYDFARLAVVHYKQGGDTMYAFNSIPETMRDLKLIQSEQEAELDSLRMLGYIFVLLTPACYAYYYFTDIDNFNILTQSFAGKAISFIALVVMIITVKLITRISKPVEL